MYQFVWAGTDELVESDELGDPTHQVMDVAYNQSATYSFFDSAIRDVNPGEGVSPSTAELARALVASPRREVSRG
jgi:hypothetical protein